MLVTRSERFMAKALDGEQIINPNKLPVRVVKCYGIIPVHLNGESSKLFIIQQKKGHWGFPKGHPEPGDKTPFDTACRELKEESNLEVKRVLSEDTISHKYAYGKNKFWREKTVLYWVAEVKDPEAVKLQASEVSDCKWVGAEEAELCFGREHTRQVAKSAIEKLKIFDNK